MKEESAGHSLGILYVALGRPYLAMALLSARTARSSNPGIPICIVTNVTSSQPGDEWWDQERDVWQYIEKDTKDNREVKTSLPAYSPFDYTIYSDCDTLFVGDVRVATTLLLQYDVGMRLNRRPQRAPSKGDIEVYDDVLVQDLPHWNSGVILFRKSDVVDDFFRQWSEAYREVTSGYDQVALARTVLECEARFLSLEERWNTTNPRRAFGARRNETRIFHYMSGINGRIARAIRSADRHLANTMAVETGEGIETFIRRKRSYKRQKLGLFRYVGFRSLLWMASPL